MIEFYFENISTPKLSYPKLKKWIKKIIEINNKKLGDISIIFCNDFYLLNINKTFLNHDYFTDIITFNYNKNEKIHGDIFISVETVIKNAFEFNETEQDEFLRVIIHGILHLVGFNDDNEIEKKLIRIKENEAIFLYKNFV